ncbi:MAG: TPM domain-containing protein [Bacteroidetes bacterium]|nr:TPM domain-containing protein [Bacteroidota bacterium]
MLTASEKEEIQESIRLAELKTSGEIRVHIDKKCDSDPFEKAVTIFNKLKMYQTRDRNGVLIYISFLDRKLAIIGDEGINNVVPTDFWESTKNELIFRFKRNEFAQGIIDAVNEAGKELQHYFPVKSDDKNELSNEITME